MRSRYPSIVWAYTRLRLKTPLQSYPSRTRPHVLFVTEKWCDCNPEKGLSNNDHNFFGSLESTGLSTQDHFFFDEYCLEHGSHCDEALLQYCISTRPTLLAYTWCDSSYCPLLTTLHFIRTRLHIPVVAIWWEAVEMIGKAIPYVDLNVNLSGHTLPWIVEQEKNLLLWTPQDPRVFLDRRKNRDIDVSFIGSVRKSHYVDRHAGLAALKNSGMHVFRAGGQREKPVSIQEYASFFQRSKITLNFSLGSDGVHHFKGRVLEALLCGAMLLEQTNPETPIWFTPFTDYVPFEDTDDLIEKVRYYLGNEDERQLIATHGHAKAQELYNAMAFWNRIFARVH